MASIKPSKVKELIEQYAPSRFLEDKEANSYLSSLLASEAAPTDEAALAEVIGQFFGDDDTKDGGIVSATCTHELARLLSQLMREDNVADKASESFPPANKISLDDNSVDKALESSHEISIDDQVQRENPESKFRDEEKAKKKQARLERKAARQQKRMHRKKIHSFDPSKGSADVESNGSSLQAGEISGVDALQAMSALELEELDDASSAWTQARQEGKSWGGRGCGGRGVHSSANTASNIHLCGVNLQFAGNELLQNATIQINGGHRYGLIGRNGVGKSTLLRRIANKSIPGFPQDMRVLLVKQEVEGGKESALRTLINSDEELSALLAEQTYLEACIDKAVGDGESGSNELAQAVERLGAVASDLDTIDADGAEKRARDLLRGLQFTNDMLDEPTENLSGGWRMRLALAQALFVPSDLILFDEPTNHLDLHALIWLADHLASSDHTLIVVSHDRSFLEMTTDIINFEHKKLVYHVGNFSAYEQQQQEKAARQAQILDASERQRAKVVSFIEQQKTSGGKKYQDPKKQRQAKEREKKLDRVGNYREDGKRYKTKSLKKLREDYLRTPEKVVIEADEPVVKLKFVDPSWPPGLVAGSALIKMEDFSFAYSPTSPLLRSFTLSVNRGRKIALVGPNGCGKSTLMNIFTEELSPSKEAHYFKGSIWRHPCLRIGHVTQHDVEALCKATMTVIEYAEKVLRSERACASITEGAGGNIRQYLGSFGLGGKHAKRPVGSLSGGERMRLCFATVLAQQPHLLCLDEPSNHLDLETLDALAAALDAFQGAVVVISHNQSFLCGFCKELWVIEKGHLEARHSDTQSFSGLFSQYRNEAVVSAKARSNTRATKAKMAKLANQHKAGAIQRGGFIG